jgi:hypothetical protein
MECTCDAESDGCKPCICICDCDDDDGNAEDGGSGGRLDAVAAARGAWFVMMLTPATSLAGKPGGSSAAFCSSHFIHSSGVSVCVTRTRLAPTDTSRSASSSVPRHAYSKVSADENTAIVLTGTHVARRVIKAWNSS